jgi:hypothetical protein
VLLLVLRESLTDAQCEEAYQPAYGDWAAQLAEASSMLDPHYGLVGSASAPRSSGLTPAPREDSHIQSGELGRLR